MKTLLIVESPAKSKTIEKLLGPNYIVKASFGHIRDLDKTELGIEVDNGYRPVYKIKSNSSKTIQELKDAMSRVDKVLLAADEDREGEAIAWHCAVVLKLNLNEQNRICFHEITQTALQHAVDNPRRIDMNMVYSQQARRILDRLVGFELSPVLQRNVVNAKSAGRVQSVCLKFIVEKENEICGYQETRYFKTLGYFENDIIGTLNLNYENVNDVQTFLETIKESTFRVENLENKQIEKRPPPPYTTSSVQQDIGSRFHIPSKMIMTILQNLYEMGKITYHRTDSTLLSDHIMREIKNHILNTPDLGRDYLHPRIYKTKSKSAQEAHEAIRPTSISVIDLDDTFDNKTKQIYQMIWRRTVASQMSSQRIEQFILTIGIENCEMEKFLAKAERTLFDGYKKIYDDTIKKDDDEEEEIIGELFGDVQIGMELENKKIISTEKIQQPPPRYSEATIIKKMEVGGIGRPSTYAGILDTLFERDYIEKKTIPSKKLNGVSLTLEKKKIKNKEIQITVGGEKNKLVPTDVGKRALVFLTDNFGNVVNETFTSDMENKLDKIASGEFVWNQTVDEYYQSFHPIVETLKSRYSSTTTNSTTNTTNPFNKRLVGVYEGINIYVYAGKFGPIYQIGNDKDKNKKYVNVKEGDDIERVTLEDFEKAFLEPK